MTREEELDVLKSKINKALELLSWHNPESVERGGVSADLVCTKRELLLLADLIEREEKLMGNWSDKFDYEQREYYGHFYDPDREETEEEDNEEQMTREEAIFCEKSYIGETNCTDCKYYDTDTCKSRESHRMAIKALEQTRWIPVSERLPEIHQDVLLELRSGEMLTGFRAETEPYFYCFGVDGCCVEPQNVIAWQPLPEPYKPEKGGEE
jgi:hypothetical protein